MATILNQKLKSTGDPDPDDTGDPWWEVSDRGYTGGGGPEGQVVGLLSPPTRKRLHYTGDPVLGVWIVCGRQTFYLHPLPDRRPSVQSKD